LFLSSYLPSLRCFLEYSLLSLLFSMDLVVVFCGCVFILVLYLVVYVFSFVVSSGFDCFLFFDHSCFDS
jgi:hypothetical protein